MAQRITIKIADRTYNLRVSSPEREEVVRKAAAEINKTIEAYIEKFPGKSLTEILSFVSLNMCINNITLRELAEKHEKDVLSLDKELKGYLETIDKVSR